MSDNGGSGRSVPKLPLNEGLYWDAMRAKWPGGAVRYATWLNDDPVVAEIQSALVQKLGSHVLGPNWQWQQPGKYDLQTMGALSYLGFKTPEGLMTGEMYDFLGISYSSLYSLPMRPVGGGNGDGDTIVPSKSIWYILAAFGGAFATYQVITKLIKSKRKRR